jgi:hypothetical protein
MASSSSAASPGFQVSHVDDVRRQRRLVVSRLGDYHEVHVTPLPSADDTATPGLSQSGVAPAASLVALVMDVSGSMAASKLLEPLKTAWKSLAKEYLATGLYRVVLIAWAYDVAHYELTEANLDVVFAELANDAVIQAKRASGKVAPNEFHEQYWSGRTMPRLGFERLLEVLNSTAACADLTVVFSTDGAFSQAPKDDYFGDVSGKVMTDAFLTELGAKMSALAIPVSMKYLGILQDHVPDAQRLMKVFPACEYSYAPDPFSIAPKTQTIVDAIREQVGTSMTLQVSVGGKVSNTLLVEGMYMVQTDTLTFPGLTSVSVPTSAAGDVPSEFFMHRRACFGIFTRIEMLKEEYFAGQSILQAVKECDQQLTALLATIEKVGTGGAEKNRTRKYLFSVMRFKNELQQFAAKQLQASEVANARLLLSKNQQLHLTLHNRYSNAVAKQITRNSDRVFEVKFDAKVEPTAGPADDARTFTVVAKVQQQQEAPGGPANSGTKEYTYQSVAVPRAVAEDESIDFITVDSFADAYASGDTRCQCVLIKKQPGETEFHTPSHIKLEAVNAQVTLSCILNTIQLRVEVEGYASLFDRPFTGETAAQFYNAVLPTYAPNLEVNARWRLRQLLGYINGGHELAFSNHSIDIYIPAVISLWSQYFETKSTKTLTDAVLLMLAFGKIKRWLKVGNQHAPKAFTAEQNVQMFLNGESGTHAFPSYWEPLIHAMLATRAVRSAPKAATAAATVSGVAPQLAPTSAASSEESKEQQEKAAQLQQQQEQVEQPVVEKEEEEESKEQQEAKADDVEADVVATMMGSMTLDKNHAIDWAKFRSVLMGEQMCKMAKYKGDGLYASCLVPMIKEIIAECNLLEVPDFKALPEFKGESEKMQQLVDGLVSKSRFELAARLLTVAPLLDAALWQEVERTYTIPVGLNARIQAALADDVTRVAVPTNPEVVAWTAVANDFPSNSTRRGMTKAPRDVLIKKAQLVLNESLDGERRRMFFKRRLDAFVETHGWFPMVMTPSQLAWLRAAVQYPDSDCERFIAEFQERFAAHLHNEQVFTKVPNEVYRERLAANLRLLWVERRSVLGQHGTAMTLSVTSLPKHRCGHPLCPEFLRFNRALESDHLKDLGLDLPPGDESRVWYPSMHMRLSENIHRSKADCVGVMMEGARRYCGAPHLEILQRMYESHWDMFSGQR